MKKIMIVAGGTGGHVFPAMCVFDELLARGFDPMFVTDKRGEKYLEARHTKGAIIQNINTSSRIFLYCSLIINILKSIAWIISNASEKPMCIIGFGGYPSIPFVLAGQIFRIKTMIHEQNAIIGKANKMLSKFADKIMLSFQQYQNEFLQKKVKYTGNPTRFENCYGRKYKKKNDNAKILIFGGSQGARIFSDQIADGIMLLASMFEIEVFQQARNEDISKLKAKYQNINCSISDFFHNIHELYKEADIVISRSGASSVFELIGFQKPAILVPFSGSINGDQEANAMFLKKHDAAIVLEEKNLTADEVFNTILGLIEDPCRSDSLIENIGALRECNPTKKIADEIEDLIKK